MGLAYLSIFRYILTTLFLLLSLIIINNIYYSFDVSIKYKELCGYTGRRRPTLRRSEIRRHDDGQSSVCPVRFVVRLW